MSIILFGSSIILCFAGVLFSLIYIWLNTFSKIADVSSRNPSIISISKSSMILSHLFALISCLIDKSENIHSVISRTSVLYSIIAVSWLFVVFVCGIVMIIVLLSKKKFKEGFSRSIKKVFVIATTGAVIGIFLSWLIS